MSIALLLLVYTLLLVAVIRLYFRLASRFAIVDEPVHRSSHMEPVIRGGGVVIPVGFAIWFIWSGFQYPWFFAGLMMVSLVSFLDDVSHMIRWIRFLVQILVIPFIIMQTGAGQMTWWQMVILFVTGAGIINAFNFMDGINGMFGIYSLVTLASLWFVNNFAGPFVTNEMLFAVSAPLVIFGYYNFRSQARCFAGDVGPAAVAFILIFLFARLILATGHFLYLWFLLIFGIDSLLTILRRLMRRENILRPHRRHLYQMLANEGGIPQLWVSAGYASAQLLINILVIMTVPRLSLAESLIAGGFLIIVAISAYTLLLRRMMAKLRSIQQ